jgi:hypothetical protein
MNTFTIENETNNIIFHTTTEEAEAVANAEYFRDEAGLAKLAAKWPAARLVEIWNSLPGTAPVRKFTDRATAVSRIWRAIQALRQTVPAVVEERMPVIQIDSLDRVSETVPGSGETARQDAAIQQSTEATPHTPGALHVPDVAAGKTRANHKATQAKKGPVAKNGPRDGSKTETILTLMKQPGGTTLKAIMKATSWQAHSVRGFVSGTLGRKMGLTVISVKGEKGDRTYSINA